MPVGQLVRPEEVASLMVFLAGASGFTGACMHLNGGLLMSSHHVADLIQRLAAETRHRRSPDD